MGLTPPRARASLRVRVTDRTQSESDLLAPVRGFATDSLERQRTAASVAGALFGIDDAAKVGRFSILERCGSGAMGTVYTAWDPRLGRRIAIKLLRDAEDVDRILHEARVTARLSHPNVVTVYDAGEDLGRSYIAMEFIDGETLQAWLQTQARSEVEVRDVFAQLARGLHAAHDAGLVHRDFKPANAMVSRRDGRNVAQVLDFGLTAAVHAEDERIAGTPAYMAPEQRIGEPPTPAADQYAFFVSLHEALTGTRPKQRPAPLDGIPRSLRRLVQVGLAQDPSDRHPSMAMVAAALEPRRSRASRWMLGAGLVTLFGGFFAATREPPPPDPCDGLRGLWTEGVDAQTLPSRVASALESYGDRWVDARTHVCKATFEYGAQTQALLEVRNDCLQSQLLEADAVADAVTESPARAAQALSVIAGLPSPEDCVSAVGTPQQPSPALERALAVLSTRLGFLEWEQSRGLAEALAKEPTSPDPSQEVRRRLLSAIAFERSGDAETAGPLLDEALDLAIEHQQPADAAYAAREKMWTLGIRGQDFAAAQRWERLGQSWLRAAGLGGGQRAAELRDRLGRSASVVRDFATAETLHREAIAQITDLVGEDSRVVVPYLVHLHSVMPRDSPAAVELRGRARALIERHFGPDHPVLAVLLGGGQFTFEDADACARAVPDFEEALRIKQRHYGPDALDLTPALNNLANCQGIAGDLGGAAASLRRAVEIHAHHQGADAPSLFTPLYNLSIAELAAEEFDRALLHAERAAAVRAAVVEETDPSLGGPQLVRAMALRGVGRIPEALAAFERTLALEDPTSTHVADRVETRLEYALALRSAGAETSAVAKIEEARALATASKDPTALAFLSSHPAVGSDSPGP